MTTKLLRLTIIILISCLLLLACGLNATRRRTLPILSSLVDNLRHNSDAQVNKQETSEANLVKKPLMTEYHEEKRRDFKRKSEALNAWEERLLLDVMPVILGQRACNENGSFEQYRDRLVQDDTNDDIMLSSPEQIIERSGFTYERYESHSDDGYSTKLLRLKNPLMANQALKQPPVMLLQAGAISPTAFIWASSGQHRPEKPRKSEQHQALKPDELDPEAAANSNPLKMLFEPLQSISLTAQNYEDESLQVKEEAVSDQADEELPSWNRSLAFVLANRGFDVWLVESRGHNSVRSPLNPLKNIVSSVDKTSKSIGSLLFGWNKFKNMTLGENLIQLTRAPHYWTYSFDEIIRHELKNQIKRVLAISGAHNVTLISYSFASMIALPFLASRPKFVRQRVHNLVLMAPVASSRDSNTLFKYLYEHACLSLPDDLIAFFGTDRLFTRPLRRLFVRLGTSSPLIRYKVLKFLFYLFQGSSGQYRTFLEPAVFGHFFEPTSMLQVKHFCQQILARKYQKYNFGIIKNLLVYGQQEPPKYNLSNLNLRNPNGLLLISAQNDNLGTRDSIEELLEQVQRPKPAEHIQVPGYGHLDLVAAVDNDIQVNLPIVDYLEKQRYYLN